MNAPRKSVSRILALFTLASALLVLALVLVSHSTEASRKSPIRLVVLIAVDQMRYDYLERFRDQYAGGLKRLLEEGTVFTNAHQDHALTVTAAGHATMLSGLHPGSSGIIGNAWVDRQEGRKVEPIESKDYPQLDGNKKGISPMDFNGTTLVDWLKASNEKSKAVSVSRKDRAAVLMVGKKAEDVYWYSVSDGSFTTSTYYRRELPKWVLDFNGRKVPQSYAGKSWMLLLESVDAYKVSSEDDFPGEADLPGFGRTFPHRLPEDSTQTLRAFTNTPWMDEYTLQFAEEALRQLELGRDGVPDVLAIGLSSTDSIGHLFGPYSKEIHDQLLRLDRMLGEFFKKLGDTVGLANTIIVLTGDHGVAPLPEYAPRLGKEGKRFTLTKEVQAYAQILKERLGEGRWMLDFDRGVLYFDHEALEKKGVKLEEVCREAAEYFKRLEPVTRVYTRQQLMSRAPPADEIERRLRHSFHPERAGDVFLIYKPYYLETSFPTGTSHGTPYEYDSHVPIIFMGSVVKAGRYDGFAATVDIAPTLAKMLGVKPLNPVDGKTLF
jgi:predicted AlkP superfamily pyrophosphatase or phosphodiesterase